MTGARAGVAGRLRARLLPAVAGSVLLVPALGACNLSAAEDPPASLEPVQPPSSSAETGSGLTLAIRGGERPRQVGQADVDVTVATLEDGTVRSITGQAGEPAFGFPPFRRTGPYPRAVVVVTNAGDEDAMNPGRSAFRWGADFRLAVPSSGRPEDNGDNLVQRGLYSETTLFKAEVDLDRPACAVRGADGIVTVRSGRAIVPGLWYHMECQREGVQVRVTVWPLSDPDDRTTRVSVGPTGDVTPDEPGVPVSIGGKVAPDGRIVQSATDQLNGDLANPFLEILGG